MVHNGSINSDTDTFQGIGYSWVEFENLEKGFLGPGRVIDAGGIVGEKLEGLQGFEYHDVVGRLKDERSLDDNMKATTEASVAGGSALVAWRTEDLAGRRGDDFAGDQLRAREQEDDHRGDPKDRESRRHAHHNFRTSTALSSRPCPGDDRGSRSIQPTHRTVSAGNNVSISGCSQRRSLLTA
jgi:hypothetical protein